LHAGVGIKSQYKDIAQRLCFFKQPDVPGMKQVVAPLGKDDSSPGRLPYRPSSDQFVPLIKVPHSLNVGQALLPVHRE
jgi:hypothetical protein